jgi:hypothetical protein
MSSESPNQPPRTPHVAPTKSGLSLMGCKRAAAAIQTRSRKERAFRIEYLKGGEGTVPARISAPGGLLSVS